MSEDIRQHQDPSALLPGRQALVSQVQLEAEPRHKHTLNKVSEQGCHWMRVI